MTDAETPKVRDNGTVPHASLAEALAAFQAEVPKMSKDEHAKVTGKSKETGERYDRSYNFAGLDQFVEIVEPVLGRHGLSVTSAPSFDDKGRYVLTVTLLHESGEERSGVWPLPDPYARGVGPQDIGSAYTYGRRYIAWGLTGTFPGGADDDGKQAQQQARERWEDARPVRQAFDQHRRGVNNTDDPAPVSAPPAPKKEWTDAEVAEQHAKLTQLSLDKAGTLYDWMAARDLHGREIASNNGESTHTATHVLALRLADEALTPEVMLDDLVKIKDFADSRGLLKVQVSSTETLEQVLYEARELIAHATIEAVSEGLTRDW